MQPECRDHRTGERKNPVRSDVEQWADAQRKETIAKFKVKPKD